MRQAAAHREDGDRREERRALVLEERGCEGELGDRVACVVRVAAVDMNERERCVSSRGDRGS